MNDQNIILLYFQRSEQAISATAARYGSYCYSIAYHILKEKRDTEEIVSDTYLDAWNAIPPHKPNSLSAFLGRIARRNALDRWEYLHAAKRGRGEVLLVLEELNDCVSAQGNLETEIQRQELGRAISLFLKQLPQIERKVFVRRYWYLESVREIAHKEGFSQSKVKSMLLRTRNKLRAYLEKEGITV